MRYGFLGPVEVRNGDRSLKIGGPQQQRLLAVLLSEPGQVIETHRLVDVLWPDGLAPEVRWSLRTDLCPSPAPGDR